MASYLYKPDCPYSDPESGMVSKQDYYQYLYLKSNSQDDKRMMIGNEPVTIRFISDTMEPTRHMVNGRLYTSKKKFRDETKARGCIEVGNETKVKPKKYIPATDRRGTREAIRQSIRDLKENRIPEGELAQIKKHAEITNHINRNRKRAAY